MNHLELLTRTDPTEVRIPRAMLKALLDIIDGFDRCDDIDPRILFIGEIDRELIEHLKDTTGLKQAAENLKFIDEHLDHDGEFAKQFTRDEQLKARSICDGFGKMSVQELLALEIAWDWSHVRDSTPEALAACRLYIEGISQRPKGS